MIVALFFFFEKISGRRSEDDGPAKTEIQYPTAIIAQPQMFLTDLDVNKKILSSSSAFINLLSVFACLSNSSQ